MQRIRYKILLVTALIIYSLLSPALIANAQANYGDELITNAIIENSKGENVNGKTVDYWEKLNAKYEFSLPDGKIKQGDNLNIQLPSELVLVNNIGFPVKDTNGNTVGNAVVDKVANTVKVTFTDYVETHNNIKGFINIWTTLNKKVVTETGPKEIQLISDAKVNLNVTGSIGPTTNEQLNKWGEVDSRDPSIVHWSIRINYAKNYINKMDLQDMIGKGQELLTDTIMTYDIVLNGNQIDWNQSKKISNDTLNLKPTDKGFSLSVENTDKTYYIKYDTKITEKGLDVAENKLDSTLDGQVLHRNSSVKLSGGSATADGYKNASVVLKKVDDQQRAIVSDKTKFSLFKQDGTLISDNLSTDKNGIVSVENLLPGNYYFLETAAPDGYILDESQVNFTIEAQQEKYVELSKVNISKTYKVGDYVWIDENKNGQQDEGEQPVKDVKVTITYPNGDTKETTTNEKGYYEFTDLNNGKYDISFEVPQGYEVTETNVGDAATDSNGPNTSVTVDNADDMTIDLGLVQKTYKVGDYVWIDENKNGQQDEGEQPVKDVKVTITYPNGDTKETTTNEKGYYEFTDLNNGKYDISFEVPQGYEVTETNVGDAATDSNGPNTSVTVDNADDMTIDLGLIKVVEEAPTTEEPTTEEPTTEAPTTEEPTTEEPTTEEPTTEAPTTEEPTTEEPTTEAPTTEVPTTEAPTTEAPTTEAPTTEEPTTEAPTTEVPTTEAPTTEAPTTGKFNEGQSFNKKMINVSQEEDKAKQKSFLPITGEHSGTIFGILAIFLTGIGLILISRRTR